MHVRRGCGQAHTAEGSARHVAATWLVEPGYMDDFELEFHDIDFLPGIDLSLWLGLVLTALIVGGISLGITTALI